MGFQGLPPSSRTQRHQQQRRLTITGIIFVILTTILLCYTRPLPQPHLLLQQLTSNTPMAEDASSLDPSSIKHPTLVSTLPSSLLPKPHAGPTSSRLIVIGDVHGQLSALDTLLAKIGYSSERGDVVVFTGDMINKGPDSPGVIDRAIAMGAYGVRGNHEDRVLRAWAKEKERKKKHKNKDKEKKKKHGSHSKAEDANEPIENGIDEEEDMEAEEPLSKTELNDLTTASHLKPVHLTWLSKLPVILRLGTISPHYGSVIVVHAGLVPGIAIEKQDAWAVMNMRTLLPSTSTSTSTSPFSSLASSFSSLQIHPPERRFEPSEGREGRPWAQVWNDLEKEKKKKRKKKEKGDGSKATATATTVVYGHDAKTGLAVRRYAFGLDSSCVRGGDLTALVFESTSSTTAAAFDGVDGREEEYDSDSSREEREEEKKNKGKKGMAKHGISHRLVSVSCEAAVSDDDKDKGGKKKKGEKKKDKSKKES